MFKTHFSTATLVQVVVVNKYENYTDLCILYTAMQIPHLRVKWQFILCMRSPVFISQLKQEIGKTLVVLRMAVNNK